MIKRVLALDGVLVICHFRDDGSFDEGYGMLPEEDMIGLAHFAHDYKRIVQGNTDQLSMFTQLNGWTPPTGWVVHGQKNSVCSIGNLVCLLDGEAVLSDVMQEMHDVSSW